MIINIINQSMIDRDITDIIYCIYLMEKTGKGIKMSAEELQNQSDFAVKKLLQTCSSPNWVKIDDKPCHIFSMKTENRVVIKGVCNIKATMKQIQAHIDNQKNYLPDNVSQNKILSEGAYGQVKYRRHKATWPVDDRDLVLIKTKRPSQHQLIIATRSINYDVPLDKGVIRAEFNIGGFIIEKVSEHECKVTHIADLDFKGSIPGIIKTKIAEAQGKIPAKFRDALEKKK